MTMATIVLYSLQILIAKLITCHTLQFTQWHMGYRPARKYKKKHGIQNISIESKLREQILVWNLDVTGWVNDYKSTSALPRYIVIMHWITGQVVWSVSWCLTLRWTTQHWKANLHLNWNLRGTINFLVDSPE